MAVKNSGSSIFPSHYYGRSTDTKPAGAGVGDTFFETDTRSTYVFSDNWYLFSVLTTVSMTGDNEIKVSSRDTLAVLEDILGTLEKIRLGAILSGLIADVEDGFEG